MVVSLGPDWRQFGRVRMYTLGFAVFRWPHLPDRTMACTARRGRLADSLRVREGTRRRVRVFANFGRHAPTRLPAQPAGHCFSVNAIAAHRGSFSEAYMKHTAVSTIAL